MAVVYQLPRKWLPISSAPSDRDLVHGVDTAGTEGEEFGFITREVAVVATAPLVINIGSDQTHSIVDA